MKKSRIKKVTVQKLPLTEKQKKEIRDALSKIYGTHIVRNPQSES